MNPKSISELFSRFNHRNPHPKIELDYNNAFTLVVAVLLSAQATDISVNKVTKQLFKVADSPQKMLQLGEEALKAHIKSIGLFNTKARNTIALSRTLVEDYDSEVPDKFEDLTRLSGIGRKSANVILNAFFGAPTIAVDTHVFRVSNRLGLVNARSVAAVERQLELVVPEQWKLLAHRWLVLHGRYLCKARRPMCDRCFVSDLCAYLNKSEG